MCVCGHMYLIKFVFLHGEDTQYLWSHYNSKWSKPVTKKAENVHVPLDLYSQFYREKYRQVDIFQTLIGYNDGTIVTVNWMRNVKTFDLK